MRITITCFLLSLVSNFCIAQIDSTYIKPFEYRLAIAPYISKDMLFVSVEQDEGASKTFIPNTPPNIGIGASINNTIISFGYGYGFDFMRDKDLGKTKAFDLQIHNYGRKIVFDIFIQRYKGFYDEEDKDTPELYPDLEVRKYGIYGQYVFNNKRFSYQAAFNQNEKQIKSAGSFLLGGGVYKTRIRSDSSFVYEDKNRIDNFQFGVSAGYAYTWVLGRYWDISASATAGINFGSEKFSTIGKKLKVYPTVFPRISAGYNRKSWSLGLSYVGNLIFSSMNDNSSIGIHSGTVKVSFTKRFDIIPFIK
ncbi:DUF4421 family protein [Dysgonomonas sp. 511]|uniref:DUF4421 family protein n=1 Tax=Dysgonomonas sp. 511 TaxID=2302930 RepID=UPI0013D08E28|nr:DUF4421 family protein [Dysgonomonas sp. 511]NDV79526.1 DUF4421 domain-containing protein [Dysgonomonas sp. 511]